MQKINCSSINDQYKTTDIKSTIDQINKIDNEGADIVRVCPDQVSTTALKEIIKNVNLPVVADIHFHSIKL